MKGGYYNETQKTNSGGIGPKGTGKGNGIGSGNYTTSGTKQGKISIEETDSIDTNFTLHSITDALDYDILIVDDLLEKKISNGIKINNDFNIKDKVIFMNKSNKLLGIYEVEENYLKVWKNFV